MRNRITFQISIDVQTLVDYIIANEDRNQMQLITYQEMNAAVGRSVKKGILQSARRILQREKAWVFGTVRTQGICRLADASIATSGVFSRKRIHREARRGVARLSCVQDFHNLEKKTQVEHNTSMSFLGAIAVASKETAVRKLRKALESKGAQTTLPKEETLRLLTG